VGVGEGVGGTIVGLGVVGVRVEDGVGEGVGAVVDDGEGDAVGSGTLASAVPGADGLGLPAGAAQAITSPRTRSTATG
jgi:hypothetical protein